MENKMETTVMGYIVTPLLFAFHLRLVGDPVEHSRYGYTQLRAADHPIQDNPRREGGSKRSFSAISIVTTCAVTPLLFAFHLRLVGDPVEHSRYGYTQLRAADHPTLPMLKLLNDPHE